MTALPAWATHEVDHRFVVSGTVLATDGTPKADVKVVVAHPRNNLSETALTDRNGRYSVLMHLHDPDAGDPVTVTVGEETKTIKAAFNPKDHHTPRGAQVDFGATPQPTAAGQSGWMMYGAAGAVLAAVVAVWWRRARKPSRAPGGGGRRKAKSRA
ncbi:MAG: carboxypeptidase-like regulatory domain-containing protein [Nitrospirota bacterium]